MSWLTFAKYQGAGNDFVMTFDPDDERPIDADGAAALCDRRFGVGADGVIRVVGTGEADVRWFMDYRNADGSEAEMCGNGIRCVAAMLHDLGAESATSFTVATRSGPRPVTVRERDGAGPAVVTVAMGTPNFTKASIPMRGPAWETYLEQAFELGPGLSAVASAVSMGNPHLVLFVPEHPDRYHVGHIGPALEHHELFPEGVNVEFVRLSERASDDADGNDDGDHGIIDARVWERGSGETMACGSGACAVAIAANEAGMTPARTTVRFPGGELEVERRDDGEVLLTGEAVHVFDGTIDVGGT